MRYFFQYFNKFWCQWKSGRRNLSQFVNCFEVIDLSIQFTFSPGLSRTHIQNMRVETLENFDFLPMKNAYPSSEVSVRSQGKPHRILRTSQKYLSDQCCKDKIMHLVVKRWKLLTLPWHEAGSWQVKETDRVPRDGAWATGWAEEQLLSHYFIVVWLLGTLADMPNQSKNYYCQRRDTNGIGSVQSFSVFQGQPPRYSRPASSCINPTRTVAGICFLN